MKTRPKRPSPMYMVDGLVITPVDVKKQMINDPAFKELLDGLFCNKVTTFDKFENGRRDLINSFRRQTVIERYER